MDVHGGSAKNMSDTSTSIADVLQTLGVDAGDYAGCACAIRHVPARPDGVEAVGIGNCVKLADGEARDLNIDGLCAMDVRTTRPRGDARHADTRSGRRLACRMLT